MIKFFAYLSLVVWAVLLSAGCQRRAYVPKGRYLLTNQTIVFEKQAYQLQEEPDALYYELEPTFQQKPNMKISLTSTMLTLLRPKLRMYGWLYNINQRRAKKGKAALPNPKKNNLFWNTMGRLSEPPVLVDTAACRKTVNSMRNLLNHKGYYNAKVFYGIKPKGKKATVVYHVQTNERTLIDTSYFYSEDSNIQRILNRERAKTLLKPKAPLDMSLFTAEKERLTAAIRNSGYEKFTWAYLQIQGDTANARKVQPEKKRAFQYHEQGEPRVVIYINVLPYSDTLKRHPFYTIRNVYINHKSPEEVGLKPHERRFFKKDSSFIYQNQQGNLIALPTRTDSLQLVQYVLRKKGSKSIMRANILAAEVPIRSGQLYNVDSYFQTLRNLNELDVFALPNISYLPVADDPTRLDCLIELEAVKKQAMSSDWEINNFNLNLGSAVNFTYRNRNLFGGAEVLASSLQVGGVFRFRADTTQSVTPLDEQTFLDRYISLLDINYENSLYYPRFVGPKFLSKKIANAKTRFSVGYRYLRQGVDLRISSIYARAFSYEWQLKDNIRHQFQFNPLLLNINFEPNLSENYKEKLRNSNPALLASLQSRFIIPSTDLSYTYTTPDRKASNAWYIKLYAEVAGNLLYALDEAIQPRNRFTVFGVDYSQFAKMDADLRYSIYISRRSSVVNRLLIGGVLPFGNSYQSGVPFPRRFFLGGPNSMRAWGLRQIGPGRVKPAAGIAFQLGDIRLEFNTEWRFKFNSWIGGALFLDMGNVWLWQPASDYNQNPSPPLEVAPDGVISANFWKELAVGTGFGLRLDFSFFIIRLDYGIQVYNPAGYRLLDTGKTQYWNVPTFNLRTPFRTLSNGNFVLGIGYPF